jgi:transcriptional regulator with XRE-family HTH domain
MEISRFIADCLKNRLKELRISNSEFAVMINMQPSNITKWLSGEHNFTISTLQKIQDVLNINFFSYSKGVYNACFPCVTDGLSLKTIQTNGQNNAGTNP